MKSSEEKENLCIKKRQEEKENIIKTNKDLKVIFEKLKYQKVIIILNY